MTVIGAVSPPGGDMTEPVTAHTQRFVRCLWTLDRDLAYARHYPAVSWAGSFSRDTERVGGWQRATGNRAGPAPSPGAAALLAEADRLAELAELIGVPRCPGHERMACSAGGWSGRGAAAERAERQRRFLFRGQRGRAAWTRCSTSLTPARGLSTRGVPATAVEAGRLLGVRSPGPRRRSGRGPAG